MRRAGRIVAEVLELVGSELKPGVSTAHLDAVAERHIRRQGGTPSFKGYRASMGRGAYPASVCISIDDEVVHGIPGDREIRAGQVVSIDAGAVVDGWHGDGARTFIVGDAPQPLRDFVDSTRRAMLAGIAAAVPGNHVGDIGAAIEDVAVPLGYGLVRQFVGHGIGKALHEPPQVPNFRSPDRGPELRPGVCLAIEPMLTMGGPEVVLGLDGWTVLTKDGSLAAHFEHTIVVTDGPAEILTAVQAR